MTTHEPLQLITGQRHATESDKAVVACNDYLRLGSGRSLRILLERYRQQTANKPPTVRFKTLAHWSTEFHWTDRAKAYDAQLEQAKNDALAARRREVFEDGLGLDFERVIKLKELAKDLEEQIKEVDEHHPHKRPNVWIRDVKQIGAGEYAEQVEIYRYNSALISDYRGVLDDLAKETGGRKQKQEHVHKGDRSAPIVIDSPALEQAAKELQQWREEQCRMLSNWQSAMPTLPTSPTTSD
ncbi:MAG TPA: hypothetical protein DEF47_18095 [Herpetosiphon sp.]|uniref:Uncharacterized protein n=1 Tax=Herpetosiphon aurantiacus (strain ATCC 23779 / DSM 785 / 114-95) TaxID=316274 RepID=A9B2I5_HERA2|nr:hypothetical protein [Herpetosiphon sp.]ABX04030.1 hypothetical protein Haur_1385 [Herpetosiphon aurantiacus DSM 785]HBW51807.1 hypothetical protein [Herpetosiphon sp.]